MALLSRVASEPVRRFRAGASSTDQGCGGFHPLLAHRDGPGSRLPAQSPFHLTLHWPWRPPFGHPTFQRFRRFRLARVNGSCGAIAPIAALDQAARMTKVMEPRGGGSTVVASGHWAAAIRTMLDRIGPDQPRWTRVGRLARCGTRRRRGKGDSAVQNSGRRPRKRASRIVAVQAWLAGVLLTLTLPVLFIAQPVAAAPQPIQFNHQLHVQRMNCIFCHRFYQTREVAGKPELSRCMLCHAYRKGESAEEKKLGDFVNTHRQLPWTRVTRVAPFVRFSHQRHVGVGKVDCAACHGSIAQTTKPPEDPLVPISMQFCMDCHRAQALRFASNSAAALGTGLSKKLLEGLQGLEHKRFRSRADALTAVARIAEAPLSEADQRVIADQLQPAPPVTTDCFACHR